ncbi:Hypothetical predicted protein [Marmota monax]|uniref:Uncharacterized protein n=1 Tax=Marmota monax TaxID=9995 RepID=A0A5E4AQ61_MARMO|nr:hypothetical protein GHT09_005829 [Marmota monax]VTJ59070.1 Hypothetical predicted protein [Marmota monax]
MQQQDKYYQQLQQEHLQAPPHWTCRSQLESPHRGFCGDKPAGTQDPVPGWCPKMGAAMCNQTWRLPPRSPLCCGRNIGGGGVISSVGFSCIQGSGFFCGSSTWKEDLQATSGWQQRNPASSYSDQLLSAFSVHQFMASS